MATAYYYNNSKIIQILNVDGVIYGLAENGDLYKLTSGNWFLVMSNEDTRFTEAG